jgi:hypothetical protein
MNVDFGQMLYSVGLVERDIKTQMYNQIGGKINYASLECVMDDFKKYLEAYKPDRENNMLEILKLNPKSLPLDDKEFKLETNINFSYFSNDLMVVMDYAKFIMQGMAKYVIKDGKELNQNIEVDQELANELKQNDTPSNEKFDINTATLNDISYKSALLIDEKNNLNFVKYNGLQFCRCKLVKDLIYYVVLCDLLLGKKETQKGGSLSTMLRGTKLSDFVEKSGDKNGNVKKGEYNVSSDNDCLSNNIITIAVLVADVALESAKDYSEEKFRQKILKSLKENSTTSTTDICSSKKSVLGKISGKIQGGMLKKLTKKLCENANKLKPNDKNVQESIKVVKSTFSMKTFINPKSLSHFTNNINNSMDLIIQTNLGIEEMVGGATHPKFGAKGALHLMIFGPIIFAVSVLIFSLILALTFSLLFSSLCIMPIKVNDGRGLFLSEPIKMTLCEYAFTFYLLTQYKNKLLYKIR